MSTQTPFLVQNENLPILRGKGVSGIKADASKPAKVGCHDRKALRDLSKVRKPILSGVSKAGALKEKSVLKTLEIKVDSKSSYLTDDELTRCEEWAKEGIEQSHFTGTDSHKLQQEKDEERVNKKVQKVLAALYEWTDMADMAYNFPMPVKDVASDSEDTIKMQLVPEELPSTTNKFTNLDDKEFEDFLSNWDFPFLDHTLELNLQEDYDSHLQLLGSKDIRLEIEGSTYSFQDQKG